MYQVLIKELVVEFLVFKFRLFHVFSLYVNVSEDIHFF